MIGTIAVFSVLYELFFQLQWIQPIGSDTVSAWIPWSAVTTP